MRPVSKPPAKPRLVSGRRPVHKAGGLGIKKVARPVDESLFDQAPEEAPAPTPVGVVSSTLAVAHQQASRQVSAPA